MNKDLAASNIDDLLARTNKNDPKPEDIKALRNYLAENPDIWRRIGSLTSQNIESILQNSGFVALKREITQASLNSMRAEMGFGEAPMLEKLLIEQVLLTWLRLQLWEASYTNQSQGDGMPLSVGIFWEKRLSAANARYLRACETLARVRKLARRDPALQVNIATQDGKQVNIAGDVTT